VKLKRNKKKEDERTNGVITINIKLEIFNKIMNRARKGEEKKKKDIILEFLQRFTISIYYFFSQN
jgi:hypothetical protein